MIKIIEKCHLAPGFCITSERSRELDGNNSRDVLFIIIVSFYIVMLLWKRVSGSLLGHLYAPECLFSPSQAVYMTFELFVFYYV